MQRKQILVVEDNDLNREMLKEILSEEYSVLEAENGQQALEILRRDGERISLILLDVMMPVMDGYTFLDKIREDGELSLIPVIVLTQGSSEEDEVSALAHGATDFVPKPYRPQVILHRVASLIKLRENAAIVNLLQYDRLTGLYTKEFFYRKVRERLDAHPEKKYCVVCSNIENFKLFNDTFGVREGDRLLKETAQLAQQMIGSTGFCGRFGADRLLCLQEQAREALDRQNYGRMELEPTPLLRSVVMRWGIYEITDRTIPVEQMCDRAMLAVDSIKGQYNRLFAVYDDALRSRLLREKTITDAMEPALAQGQFEVYLQPKYSLKEDCVAGAEALVRWIHPEWGFLSPGEFIPLFEKNGFIPRLDQYIWERVCALLGSWKKAGHPRIPISVNISRADVYQLDLVKILVDLTQKYDVDPQFLHLEITESAYVDNASQIVTTLRQLRELGFPIEMDDFGSGYSSLNMLGQLRLDILKLDMKFVQNEIAKPADQSILNDIVTMAHRLRLGVVAEGVETREQVQRLQSVGCDYVQGYFFAKPMPVRQFEALWQAQNYRRAGIAAPVPAPKSRLGALLVADEDAAYREQVFRSFTGNYRVLSAPDAQSALTQLREDGGVSVVLLSMTLPDDGAATVLHALRQDPAFWRIQVIACIPDGTMMEKLPLALETDDFLCKCHPMFDLHRRVEGLMELVEARARETTLLEEANQDYLTGLLNRRGLQMVMDSLRKEDLPLAVCLFDLDNLKETNDTSGHDAGDQQLQFFAALLRRKTRAGDILCRYGGDEFVAVLKHLREGADAMKKARDICRAYQDGAPSDTGSASCSVGIALCAAGECPTESLLAHADEAMYRAKREHKGDCCLWDDSRHEKT